MSTAVEQSTSASWQPAIARIQNKFQTNVIILRALNNTQEINCLLPSDGSAESVKFASHVEDILCAVTS